MNPLVMPRHTLRSVLIFYSCACVCVCVCVVTSFQILLLQFCTNLFSFSSHESSVGIPVGARIFSSAKSSARLLGTPSFLRNGYRGKTFGS
jgi:hypothetical protein